MRVRSTRGTNANHHVGEALDAIGDVPDGFREITPADTPWLFDTFDQFGKRAWCYYGPFLSCYHLPPGRSVLVGTFESSTCLLARTERKQVVYNLIVPPLPFDPTVTNRLVEDLAGRTGTSPRVLWCDEEDAKRAGEIGMTAEEKEQEYFYDPAQVAALEGPRYKDLRKRIRRAEREYDPTFREMNGDDIAGCHQLLKHWRKVQGRKQSFLLDWGYTRAALDRFGDWSVQDLGGWCVEVRGQLAAFALAGRMASDQACFFVAKANPDLPRVSDYLRYRVYEALSGFRLVNDAGDLDLPGLRQHKRKFCPVETRPVFTLVSE